MWDLQLWALESFSHQITYFFKLYINSFPTRPIHVSFSPLSPMVVPMGMLAKQHLLPVLSEVQFSSVQSLSHVRLFANLWSTARQASQSITNSRSSPRLTSIESEKPSSHLILSRPLSLLPSIPPSIKVFPNESTLRMRWPKYWSFSFSIIPSKEIPGLISFRYVHLELYFIPPWIYFWLIQPPKRVNSISFILAR